MVHAYAVTVGTVFEFEHTRRDGLHRWATGLRSEEMPAAIAPALLPLEWTRDRDRNPHLRFGVSVDYGEALALWRSFAWAMTAGLDRMAIPTWNRDEAAKVLGIDRHHLELVRWEYSVDPNRAPIDEAESGFVRAQSAVRPDVGRYRGSAICPRRPLRTRLRLLRRRIAEYSHP